MKILVVGSGPSGVHFALSVLRKNHQVTMIDVGRRKPAPMLPNADFGALKRELDDPAGYFLGADFGAITLPAKTKGKEYYGLPPSKDYVFEIPKLFSFVQDGLEPLVSFAAGGLAECWTAGSYPLNDAELSDFPFNYEDIAPHYEEVAARIGVAGEKDDLSAYIPIHRHLSPMLKLDSSSARLVEAYERRRESLSRKYRTVLGRSRQAVLSQTLGSRSACTYCGRCLWGCPNGALYTPSLTLAECLSHGNFTYVPDVFASHVELTPDGAIERLVGFDLSGRGQQTYNADAYVLACGTLSSSNLVLRSIYKAKGEIIRLNGLMDNRQILAPFFNLSMLGVDYDPNSYQYHQLAVGIETDTAKRYVHGQITTLKTATTHSIFHNLPLDLNSSIGVFRALRSGLGVLNLNFCDWRRSDNYLTLSPGRVGETDWPSLAIRYRPAADEQATIKKAYSTARGFMAKLGAPLVPGMTHIRPMGASVHYSGTLPMSAERKPWAVSPACQSYDIANLFVVDGAVMPFLPAKNLTFTLMANATRVAAKVF